jgi:hypothetical protein
MICDKASNEDKNIEKSQSLTRAQAEQNSYSRWQSCDVRGLNDREETCDDSNIRVIDQHVIDQHVIDQHVIDQHVIDQHVIDQHVIDQHVIDQHVLCSAICP